MSNLLPTRNAIHIKFSRNIKANKSIKSHKDIVVDFCLLPIKEPARFDDQCRRYSPA